jgi:hypothetical protein
VELCECRATPALCDRCVDDLFAQLGGVAACRGETWANSVMARVRTHEPWPETPKAWAIAQRRVEDLTRDQRLLARLTAEVAKYAARRWSQLLSGDRARS